jgi:hypothetical protein
MALDLLLAAHYETDGLDYGAEEKRRQLGTLITHAHWACPVRAREE